jgi:hypothetical protein
MAFVRQCTHIYLEGVSTPTDNATEHLMCQLQSQTGTSQIFILLHDHYLPITRFNTIIIFHTLV